MYNNSQKQQRIFIQKEQLNDTDISNSGKKIVTILYASTVYLFSSSKFTPFSGFNSPVMANLRGI